MLVVFVKVIMMILVSIYNDDEQDDGDADDHGNDDDDDDHSEQCGDVAVTQLSCALFIVQGLWNMSAIQTRAHIKVVELWSACRRKTEVVLDDCYRGVLPLFLRGTVLLSADNSLVIWHPEDTVSFDDP